jgi:hypothetical protein
MYWYRDNWYGEKHSFKTFSEAKSAASKETGVAIIVYGPKGFKKIVNASGHTPA